MIEPQTNTQADSALLDDVCRVVRQTLQLPEETALGADTLLLGAIAEFDSMSVVSVLTELEEQFGFFVDDDEISAETFESIGTLVDFEQSKVQDSA